MPRKIWQLHGANGWQPHFASTRVDGVIERPASELAERHPWIAKIIDHDTGEQLWPETQPAFLEAAE